MIMSPQHLAPLPQILRLTLFELGQASLLLGLQLQPPDMFPCLSDRVLGCKQGAVCFALCGLGAHEALAGG
jgi:hypothetical protein